MRMMRDTRILTQGLCKSRYDRQKESNVDCSKGAIAMSLGQKVVLSFNGYWGKRSE
jgi:hypothetical protein